LRKVSQDDLIQLVVESSLLRIADLLAGTWHDFTPSKRIMTISDHLILSAVEAIYEAGARALARGIATHRELRNREVPLA